MSALLEVSSLSVVYGGLRAVDDVSLRVERGQLVGLIGPNGAGKTSFIDALTGFAGSKGTIILDGHDLSTAPPHTRARAGLVRTWQSLELFDDISVRANLLVAAERSSVLGFILDLVNPNRRGSTIAVDQVLADLGLGDVVDRLPSQLPQGQRKLVGVARALASQPKILLMDEPAAGLDTDESLEFGRRLRAIVADGTSVLLVDHDMSLVLGFSDYIYVLEFGNVIANGTPAQVRKNDTVKTAYLGYRAEQPPNSTSDPVALRSNGVRQ